MFKVIIADDLPEFLDWLQSLLEGCDEFRVVGTAGTGKETPELVDREGPDLVIADVEMPDLNGLQVARRIRRDWPKTSVILISNHDAPTYEKLAIEVRALAFIPKKSAKTNSVICSGPGVGWYRMRQTIFAMTGEGRWGGQIYTSANVPIASK